MNPMVVDILKTLIRFAIVGIGGWLIEKGVFTSDQVSGYAEQAGSIAAGVLFFVAPIAWSLRDKFMKRRTLIVALDKTGASEQSTKNLAKGPDAPSAFERR